MTFKCIVGTRTTMIDNQEDSMKMQPPINTQGGSEMPTGLQSAGPMHENKKYNIMEESKKHLEKLNKDLALIEMHHKV